MDSQASPIMANKTAAHAAIDALMEHAKTCPMRTITLTEVARRLEISQYDARIVASSLRLLSKMGARAIGVEIPAMKKTARKTRAARKAA